MAANKVLARDMAGKWKEACPTIITAIAKAIHKKLRLEMRWVAVADLIPDGVTSKKFASVFKFGLEPFVGGSFKRALVDDETGLLMICHVFSDNKNFLWVGPNSMTKEEVLAEIGTLPIENAQNRSIATKFHKECKEELVEPCGMEQIREISTSTPTITHHQESKNEVISALLPANQLKTYAPREAAVRGGGTCADAKRKEELEALVKCIDGEPAAADVISFMMSQEDAVNGAPMKLIKSILDRPSVKRTGHILPRTASFAEAGDQNQQNAVRILSAMVNKCAKLLLKNYGKNGQALLIDAVINSATFWKYSLPSREMEKYVG